MSSATTRTFAVVATLAALALAFAGSAAAKKRATCFGHRATVVGTKHADKIRSRPGDVVVAGGGADTIVGAEHGRNIICGGTGGDRLIGGMKRDVLIGGPGRRSESALGHIDDLIKAHPGNDLIVGDCANPSGSTRCRTGEDELNGAGGRDFVVGDNWASADAVGGAFDHDLRGGADNDTVIGDSAATRCGDATGNGSDNVEGEKGRDLIIGDSYSRCGSASDQEGTDRDLLNGGFGPDRMIGDNYTITGMASGAGNDRLNGLSGEDYLYGDDRAAKPSGRIAGGGRDSLNGASSDDHIDGGPEHDIANGGAGEDAARRCEFEESIERRWAP